VHAYERNYQTLNYTINGCAPRWLTMGDHLPFKIGAIQVFSLL
jgi:hypothetical protein